MKKLLNQIIRFLFVGGASFVVDYGVLIFCCEAFGIYYLLSSMISYSVSTLFNYWLSVMWVFDVDDQNGLHKFISFILFSLMGLALTQLIMWTGVDLLDISYLLVKIDATGIVMVFNFLTRKWILEKV